MKKYNHLFWDLDHTLWDFEKNSISALQQVYIFFDLQSKGVAPFEQFNINYHIHNNKYWERFRKGFITREKMRWKRMYATLLDYKIADENLANLMGEKYLEYLPMQKNIFDGALEILDYAKQKGYQQHIITNGFENTQILKMKNSNMYSYFSEIITSERAMSLKPHSDIFHYALKQTGATNFNSLMIGDAIDIDVLGAMQINMDAVWFNPNKIEHTMKRTFEISSLQEIMQII